MTHKKKENRCLNLDSPELLTVKAEAAGWLVRILKAGGPVTDNLIKALEYIFCGLGFIIEVLKKGAESLPAGSGNAEFKKRWRQKLTGSDSYRLYHFFNECSDIEKNHFISVIINILTDLSYKFIDYSNYINNAKHSLSKIFGISRNSCSVVSFFYLLSVHEELNPYFSGDIKIYRRLSINKLAIIINLTCDEVYDSIDECIFSNIFSESDSKCHFNSINGLIHNFYKNKSVENLKNFCCSPLTGKSIPLKNYQVPPEEICHIKSLLTRPGSDPVNVLLYGPPGTGKTSFVKSLAASLKVKVWQVNSTEKYTDAERRSSMMACFNIVSNTCGAIALVDEAERMLDTRWAGAGLTGKDKAWLNSVLEAPGRRAIWITNQIDHIDPSVRRRFQYSVHFDDLGPAERRNIWHQVVNSQKIGRFFKKADINLLVSNYNVPAAVIEESVKQAKSIGSGKKDFIPAVERILRAQVILQQDGRPLSKTQDFVREFDLDGVCLEDPVSDLLDSCRLLDSCLRNREIIPAGGGTILFYGPPGTGKTALAKYIAKIIERPYQLAKAADLLNCYVGETEKKISGVFQMTEREGSVLIIDEADSFLYSRDIAVRSWETSLVNQFLTSLEEFRGLCICTTNRREDLDMAVMRRFSFKYAFTYAAAGQILALYQAHLAPLAKNRLTEDEERELLSLTKLTPGDFHTVRSRHWLAGPESQSSRKLIEALKTEQKLKLDKLRRPIGY